MPEVRVAAIDCGTNSIRLLVADVDGDHKRDLVREMRIVRLGQDVDRTGRLADEAVARTLDATREYASLIDALGATHLRFCATSATRDATNAAEFADGVQAILGVRPVVLSGDEEALASFTGATREFGVGESVVVDLGGGSTEFVLGAGGAVAYARSFDVGSVRMTERHLHSDPPTVAEITDCIADLDGVFAALPQSVVDASTVIGVAGTITTVAAHTLGLDTYDRTLIHGARLPVADVRSACLDLLGRSVADRRRLGFMHPGRADVIGAGALVLDRALERLSAETLLVSERDILDGIAWAAASA